MFTHVPQFSIYGEAAGSRHGAKQIRCQLPERRAKKSTERDRLNLCLLNRGNRCISEVREISQFNGLKKAITTKKPQYRAVCEK